MFGEVAYSGPGQELVLTLLQRFEDNSGDGRQPFSESLRHELTGQDKSEQAPDSSLLAWKVGDIIASMHLVLGECKEQAFGSMEITEVDVEEWSARALALLRKTMAEAQRKQKYLGGLVSDLLPELASREGRVVERFKSIKSIVGMPKIRTHQDLHLAQLLTVQRSAKNLDFLVIDFEGDPQRKGAARRERDCPLRDLGTMARSFSYLRYYVLKELLEEAGCTRPIESLAFYDLKRQYISSETLGMGLLDRLFSVSKNWETRVRQKMLQGYLDVVNVSNSRLLSGYERMGSEAVDSIVRIWELEKAVLELNYELSYRPENVLIPLVGVLGLT
jgi:maltose alpha-D-glucosyltransferase/alpha-amylase